MIFRCARCAKGLDANAEGHTPKKQCSECGCRRFESNRVNLKPEEQLKLYEEFGIWFSNSEDLNWLDKEIIRVGNLPPGRAQDKQEAILLKRLRSQ